MNGDLMNESIRDVLKSNLLEAYVSAADKKALQPITRTFKRFFKSKVAAYLKKETGLDWDLGYSNFSISSMEYRANAAGSGRERFYIVWSITPALRAGDDKFTMSVSLDKGSGRYVSSVHYSEPNYLSAKDFKNVHIIAPPKILTDFKDLQSGTYTKEIESVKQSAKKLSDELKEITNFVKEYTAVLNKALKSPDVKSALIANKAKLDSLERKMPWADWQSSIRSIRDRIDTIARGD